LIKRRGMRQIIDITCSQEVLPVSPSLRGDRVVIVSSPAGSLLGLLGLGLLLLGRLPI
jgi:hypothetical protein